MNGFLTTARAKVAGKAAGALRRARRLIRQQRPAAAPELPAAAPAPREAVLQGNPAPAPAAPTNTQAVPDRPSDSTPPDTPEPLPPLAPFRRIGVVVPVYGHARLAVEAIESALASRLDIPLTVVAVDDGDPSPETRAALDALRAAHRGRLHTLRQANGGLSAARNTGVRALMALAHDVDAVFFLDADNRLEPYALRSYAETLHGARSEDRAVGWAFPDVHAFGLTDAVEGVDARETAEADTTFRHLRGNMSEAGSLVVREVFEAGVRFDEAMRSGFEDWDFWFSAREAGFAGVRVRDPGFLYRVRPESMVAQSRRETERLLAYMRDKHQALFARPAVLRAEHEEAPRFLMADLETGALRATSDPLAPGRALTLSEFRDRVAAYLRDPQAEDALPPILIVHQGVAAAPHEWPRYLRSLVFETTAAPLRAPRLVQIEPGAHLRRVPDNARYARRVMETSTALLALIPVSELARIVFERPRLPGLTVARDVTEIEHWTLPVREGVTGPAGRAIGPRRIGRLNALLRPIASLTLGQPLPHATRMHRGPIAGDARAFVSDVLCGYDTWPPFPNLRGDGHRVLLGLAPGTPGWLDALPALHAFVRDATAAGAEISVLMDGQTRSADLDAAFPDGLPANVILDPGPFPVETATFGYHGQALPVRDPHAHPHVMAIARGHDAVVALGLTALTPVLGEMKGDGLAVLGLLPDAFGEAAPDTVARIAAYEHAHHAILAGPRVRERLGAMGVPAARMAPVESAGTVLRDRLNPNREP